MEALERHAVGNYIKNYMLNGLSGLEMKYSTGAKRKLNKNQGVHMVEVIMNNTADEVGFEGRKNWTIEIIRQWCINEFHIEMIHSGMATVLHGLNLSYTSLLMY
jgi:transposase